MGTKVKALLISVFDIVNDFLKWQISFGLPLSFTKLKSLISSNIYIYMSNLKAIKNVGWIKLQLNNI